jgi:pantoate--beta-alanine ligase
MKLIKDIHTLSQIVSSKKHEHISIGFVPTMGALHEGHISLIQQSLLENDFTIASIFVNPLQFNNPDDLEKYPRTLDRDMQMLESAGCNALFAPETSEVYPGDEQPLQFDLGNLANVMEGKFRTGHFAGVITIVHKLFSWVKPDVAYFGEKDFQQLAVIRKMAKALHPNVIITGCPTLREPNGLAMSSRNVRLNKTVRHNASIIYKAMQHARQLKNVLPVYEVCSKVRSMIEEVAPFKVEYIEIADAVNLQPLQQWSDTQSARIFVAVFANDVRLIDNAAL